MSTDMHEACQKTKRFTENVGISCRICSPYIERKSYIETSIKKTGKMACNADFVDYIADQCSGAGEIVTKKMFGDYAIYCNGKIFGLICDDCLYLKPTKKVQTLLREEVLRPPYEGAKDYFYIADVDDRDYLSMLVSETCKELPEQKKRKR